MKIQKNRIISDIQLYMKQAAVMVQGGAIAQQTAAQLPWGHIMLLLDRVKDQKAQEWYAIKAYELGWSRNRRTGRRIDGSL